MVTPAYINTNKSPDQLEMERLKSIKAGINQPGFNSGLVGPPVAGITSNMVKNQMGGMTDMAAWQRAFDAGLTGQLPEGARPLNAQVQSMSQPQTMAAQPRAMISPGQNPNPAQQNPAIAQAQFREVAPVYRTVQDNETVRGQLGEIMATDSPLLQRARAAAAARMQGSGLLNSSMAMGAGEAAMLDVAVPIAMSDAQIRSQAANLNTAEANESGRFNAGQFGETSRFNAGSQNQFGLENVRQSGENYRQQVSESGQNQRQQVSERGAMDRLNISESGQTLRSREQNQTQLQVTDKNNATQRYGIDTQAKTARYSTDVGAQISREGFAVQREGQKLSADTARYTAGLSASTQRDIANLANQAAQSRGGAELLNSAENRIAQIINNPDISPQDRQTYITNQYNSVKQGLGLLRGVSSINLAVG